MSIFQNLVDHFGTQKETAKALEVDQSTVSGWVTHKWSMSPTVAVRAERATDGKFRRQDLCPDFPWDESAA